MKNIEDKHISVFIYQRGIVFLKPILWSCVLGIWMKVPLRFKGQALEHGNQQLWRKILIFQEGRIMVCPTNMGNIKCSSVRQFYSFFTNMLQQLAQSIAKLWDVMVSLTWTYMQVWKGLSYFEIFNMVLIAFALTFDDFHGWASGHLRECYLLCLMEISEYKDVEFLGRNWCRPLYMLW